MRHHDLHGYLSSWAQELHARSNRVRQLIGDAHWLSDGHHKEYLLRDFIQRYLSPDLLISRGFICTPSRVRKCSKEIDILISAPSIQAPLFNEGGLQIMTPRAVVGHLEIKSKCTKSNLRDALQNQTHTQRLITNPAKRASIWRGIVFYESDPSLNSTKALTWLAQMISDTVAHTQRKSPSQPTTDASYFPNCIVTTRASYRRRVRRERFEWPLGDCIPGSPWTGGSWRFGNRLRRTFGCGSTRRLSA